MKVSAHPTHSTPPPPSLPAPPFGQDDPNSQNKLEDPMKAPTKEDDSLNIHNSLTPKHENHKVLGGEENSSEVNSLQNNMMWKSGAVTAMQKKIIKQHKNNNNSNNNNK